MSKRSPVPSRAGQTFQIEVSYARGNQLTCYLVLELLAGPSHRTWRCLRLTDGKPVWIGEDALASYQARGCLLSQASAQLPPDEGAGQGS